MPPVDAQHTRAQPPADAAPKPPPAADPVAASAPQAAAGDDASSAVQPVAPPAAPVAAPAAAQIIAPPTAEDAPPLPAQPAPSTPPADAAAPAAQPVQRLPPTEAASPPAAAAPNEPATAAAAPEAAVTSTPSGAPAASPNLSPEPASEPDQSVEEAKPGPESAHPKPQPSASTTSTAPAVTSLATEAAPVSAKAPVAPAVAPVAPVAPTAPADDLVPVPLVPVPLAPSPLAATAPTAAVPVPKPVSPAAPSAASSSLEASMYESPSPPSSASSNDYATPHYGSIARRRRAPATEAGDEKIRADGGMGLVPLQSDGLRSISPIQTAQVVHRRDSNIVGTRPIESLPYSDMPDVQTERMSPPEPKPSLGWQGSSFVPVLADETTGLISSVNMESASMSGSDALLSQSRADLERARMASSREFNRREMREGMKDRYILGCSILVMASVVFIIIVSGMTTILAHRNFPQLEVYSDWPNGGIIPLKYGCHAPDGNPVSIPLHWRNVPREATNLAVLFAHPGAISTIGIDPVHWFVTDIPLIPQKDGFLPANASRDPDLMPEGAKQHANAFSSEGYYWPPCVSNGTSFFVVHVYAIDASPDIKDFRDAREIINRFVGVPVARITGLYGKTSPLVIPDKEDPQEHR